MYKEKKLHLICFLVFTLLVSCGPSPEAVATMTASAWTPTPEPTPTATPMPYDVFVDVVNETGDPILYAEVQLVEAGEEMYSVDEAGEVQFMNLPGENVTVNVFSPGYFPSSTTHTIERGENTIEIQMEADPNGLLPQNACLAEETLLMVEDFQDQDMHEGWSQLSDRLASGVPFIEVSEDAYQPGNMLLKHFISDELGHYSILSFDESIGDAALRFNLRITVGQHVQVGWHSTEEGVYIAFIFQNDARGGVVEKHLPSDQFTAFPFRVNIADEEWHLIEISTFEGTYSLWIDGKKMGSWLDQQALGPGKFFIDVLYQWEPDQTTEFDNFSVCELSAPFTTLFIEEEES